MALQGTRLLPHLARRVPMATAGPFPTLLPACAAAAFTQPPVLRPRSSTLHIRALAGEAASLLTPAIDAYEPRWCGVQ
jgi:hypothetical protein